MIGIRTSLHDLHLTLDLSIGECGCESGAIGTLLEAIASMYPGVPRCRVIDVSGLFLNHQEL